MRRQKLDQCLVRFAVRGARRDSDLDALAVLARELGTGCTGLDVQVQNHTVAAAMRGAKWFSMISST